MFFDFDFNSLPQPEPPPRLFQNAGNNVGAVLPVRRPGHAHLNPAATPQPQPQPVVERDGLIDSADFPVAV
jgi:hypothetical protein